jgi:hypothetical protein
MHELELHGRATLVRQAGTLYLQLFNPFGQLLKHAFIGTILPGIAGRSETTHIDSCGGFATLGADS